MYGVCAKQAHVDDFSLIRGKKCMYSTLERFSTLALYCPQRFTTITFHKQCLNNRKRERNIRDIIMLVERLCQFLILIDKIISNG